MKKTINIFLAAMIFMGMLSACGTAGSRGTADSVIKQINQHVTELMKTTKSNYTFSEELNSGGINYVVYEGKEKSGDDQKEFSNKCSILFKNEKLIGIKLEAKELPADNFSFAKYSLWDIKEIGIPKDIDPKKYFDSLDSSGSKIEGYEVYREKTETGEIFKLIKSDQNINIKDV